MKIDYRKKSLSIGVGAAIVAFLGITVYALLEVEDDLNIQGDLTEQGVAVVSQAEVDQSISNAMINVQNMGGPFGDISQGSFTTP